jgi:hypothetical protein
MLLLMAMTTMTREKQKLNSNRRKFALRSGGLRMHSVGSVVFPLKSLSKSLFISYNLKRKLKIVQLTSMSCRQVRLA